MAVGKEKEARMDPDMEVYRKLGTPGAPHKLLTVLAGSWNARARTWTGPDSPPMEWPGSSEQKMILGGRFLQQEFSGEMTWGLYNGVGFTGYDHHEKKYVSTWMDNLSTGILYFEGTAGADGRTITQTARFDDPVRGPMAWRSVTKIVDDNTLLFEMYGAVQGGREEKRMEITYTRK